MIGLWLHMGFSSNVSLTVRLKYSVTVRHEGCREVDTHGTGLFQKSGQGIGFGVWECLWG